MVKPTDGQNLVQDTPHTYICRYRQTDRQIDRQTGRPTGRAGPKIFITINSDFLINLTFTIRRRRLNVSNGNTNEIMYRGGQKPLFDQMMLKKS